MLQKIKNWIEEHKHKPVYPEGTIKVAIIADESFDESEGGMEQLFLFLLKCFAVVVVFNILLNADVEHIKAMCALIAK